MLLNTLQRARAAWRATTAPAREVHSNYRCAKKWVGDTLMCYCTFPQLRMRETLFGYRCTNDQCDDFISKKDAKHVERMRLDTNSVLSEMRSSSVMRSVAKAEKTGNYMRAFIKD